MIDAFDAFDALVLLLVGGFALSTAVAYHLGERDARRDRRQFEAECEARESEARRRGELVPPRCTLDRW